MQEQDVQFFSDGLKLVGSWFCPDGPVHESPQPLVVVCSGFTGLRRIHPARFARYLTARGHICFGFDYRGFAESEGTRGRVLLEEQVRDIRHACAFAAADDRIDENRVVLLGWGMGAGLVLDAARRLPGVIGLIAVNGFYNGQRVQQAHRDQDGYQAFLENVTAERQRRARTGNTTAVDPFDIYPLDAQSRAYVDAVLRKTPGYDAQGYSMELADSLLRWEPEAYAPGMSIPLLVAHGSENRLHPASEARSLYERYGGPKSLYWLQGAGHTEFMHDDDPKFQALAGHINEWINQRRPR